MSFYDSAHFVAVLNSGLGLLYTGFEFTEPIGYTDSEVSIILGIGIIAPTNDVTLCCAGVIMHVLVEGSIDHQSHGETVVAEERALQGEGIAPPRAGVGIDILRAVTGGEPA